MINEVILKKTSHVLFIFKCHKMNTSVSYFTSRRLVRITFLVLKPSLRNYQIWFLCTLCFLKVRWFKTNVMWFDAGMTPKEEQLCTVHLMYTHLVLRGMWVTISLQSRLFQRVWILTLRLRVRFPVLSPYIRSGMKSIRLVRKFG